MESLEVAMPALLAAIAVASFTTVNYLSPLARAAGTVPGRDSAVFTYVAKVMYQGGLPYVDAFDNKGPLMYFIDLVGLTIHHQWGIWAVEMAFLAVTTWLCYRIARLFGGHGLAVAATIVSVAGYAKIYDGGNLTEDYSLPLILGAILLAARRWRENVDSGVELAVMGALGGGIALLRPNLLGPWVVLGVILLFDGEFDLGERVRHVSVMVAGGLGVVTPVVLFFALRGALPSFYDSYIRFNSALTGTGTARQRLLFMPWANETFWLLLPMAAFYLSAPIIQMRSRRGLFYFFLSPAFLLMVVMTSLSGRTYLHYLIPLVPFVVVPVAAALAVAVAQAGSRRRGLAVLVALSLVGTAPAAVGFRRPMAGSAALSRPSLQLAAVARRMTSADEKILVVGINAEVYLESDRMAASRFFYQDPLALVSQEYRAEFLRSLEDAPRIVLVAESEGLMDGWGDFLADVEGRLRTRYERFDHSTMKDLPKGSILYVRRSG